MATTTAVPVAILPRPAKALEVGQSVPRDYPQLATLPANANSVAPDGLRCSGHDQHIQAERIAGSVVDTNNNPVAGAIVKLRRADYIDTTQDG